MCDHKTFWPQPACLPSLSGSEHTDRGVPERLLQVHCVTNHSRQPPTHKGENDNLWYSSCLLGMAIKMERFHFYPTSEGAGIVSGPSVGGWAAEDVSSSCQSAGGAMWLIRPILPSAVKTISEYCNDLCAGCC